MHCRTAANALRTAIDAPRTRSCGVSRLGVRLEAYKCYPDFRYSTQEATIFVGTAAHNPLINCA
jgi:hypothetical protein